MECPKLEPRSKCGGYLVELKDTTISSPEVTTTFRQLEDGCRPIINGWRVPSCPLGKHELPTNDETRSGSLFIEFLGGQSYLVWFEDGQFTSRQGPFVVQPGEVWVLGDNRHNSYDSRRWNSRQGAGVPIR
ncbi:MAG: hypothetical protein RJA70_3810 [Pseudomonadota bacterium]|jgi:hypothetical protein